jgi:hypothetical protein
MFSPFISLLNKYTMLLFGFGMAIGLLLTSFRRFYLNKWLWISALIAIIIWFPNLIWQQQHGWPFLEHIRVLQETQLSNVQPLVFMLVQLLILLYSAPIWISGYAYLQFSKEAKTFQPLAYLYLSALLVLLIFSGKSYYLAPAYPMLLAAGGVVIEKYIAQYKRFWIQKVILTVVIIGNVSILPVGMQIFSVEGMIGYFEFSAKYMGAGEALRWETGELHELPQDFADMIGWRAMAEQIDVLHKKYSGESDVNYAIYGANYGITAALDYHKDDSDLPQVISHHGSFWIWGTGDYAGGPIVIAGLDSTMVASMYHLVRHAGNFIYPHARESGMPIVIASDPKESINQMWEELKRYRY